MRKRLITPPSPAIGLIEAKENLRVDHAEDDALIQRLITAASARVEREAGVAFGEQTWEAVLEAFPAEEIELPIGPLVSVTSIAYLDADGAEQTIAAEDYEIEEGSDAGVIVPLSDWPGTKASANAVVVRYVAGRGWPEDVKQAVHLIVGHWYLHREAVGERREELPYAATVLIGLHRRMFA